MRVLLLPDSAGVSVRHTPAKILCHYIYIYIYIYRPGHARIKGNYHAAMMGVGGGGVSKERLFIQTWIHNMQIFGEIPFVKPQNDT